ncbi:hypothetical protein BaRGS_00017572, partial [Batillaria attramentaria]
KETTSQTVKIKNTQLLWTFTKEALKDEVHRAAIPDLTLWPERATWLISTMLEPSS